MAARQDNKRWMGDNPKPNDLLQIGYNKKTGEAAFTIRGNLIF
jgi:hypothetical protein